MRSFDPDDFVERRASRRLRVTCDAVIETLTGQATGKLWDISEHGARLELSSPPETGATARLRWAGYEEVCRVVWSQGDRCGVAFDRPLDQSVVVETAELNRVIELPIARVANIAPGRRRSWSALPAPVGQAESASSAIVGTPQDDAGEVNAEMPAAQAMFFYGAPFAHIVAYHAYEFDGAAGAVTHTAPAGTSQVILLSRPR